AHLGDLEEKKGDAQGAARSFQRGLAVDKKGGDPRSAASDWFNYGQFLRRHKLPAELAYACFLEAERLLADASGDEFQTVQAARREVESELGKKADVARKDAPQLLARAANLPATSF
ncbi:MAG TPA: hypothetical protein VEF54_02655, partial [archaeon]|nr:hypothetical protein [archaeon]